MLGKDFCLSFALVTIYMRIKKSLRFVQFGVDLHQAKNTWKIQKKFQKIQMKLDNFRFFRFEISK